MSSATALTERALEVHEGLPRDVLCLFRAAPAVLAGYVQSKKNPAKTVRCIDTASTAVNVVLAVKNDQPYLRFFNQNSIVGSSVRLNGAVLPGTYGMFGCVAL